MKRVQNLNKLNRFEYIFDRTACVGKFCVSFCCYSFVDLLNKINGM